MTPLAYHDNNAANKVRDSVPINKKILRFGQNFSPYLTCSLFSTCQTNATAINCGGQQQPYYQGVNYITESAGYCKAY